jgi:uncharacterized membrane protein
MYGKISLDSAFGAGTQKEAVTVERILDLILLFFAYAFLGWCIEVTLKYFEYHRFINRGFLTGPLLPIYGSGAALITVCANGLKPLESGYGTTFALSFILCGVLEYMSSYFMEKRFHARWWDYSQKPMNLQGRIWIGNLALFGLGGVLIVHAFNPILYRVFDQMSLLIREITAGVLLAAFVADYIMSHFVLKLVKTGVESSEADNTEEISKEIRLLLSDRSVFYRRFADAYPEVIYRTDRIVARLNEIRDETDRLRRVAEQRVEKMEKRLDEKKEYLSNRLELTGSIKNSVIQDQEQLILMLYDDTLATEEMRLLKQNIDRNISRLDERFPLSPVSGGKGTKNRRYDT